MSDTVTSTKSSDTHTGTLSEAIAIAGRTEARLQSMMGVDIRLNGELLATHHGDRVERYDAEQVEAAE